MVHSNHIHTSDSALFDAVAEFGKLLGLNKSASLALALLFTADRPLCLDEITEQSGIAKSSNSVILKNLEQMGLIESIDQPHDRRKFFQMVDDPGDAFAVLIARRLDSMTSRQHEIHNIEENNHSDQYDRRVAQLKAIYLSLLQAASYLRTRKSEAWEDLTERFVIDNS